MSQNIGVIDLGLSISKSIFNQQLSGIAKGAQAGVTAAFKPLGNKIGMVLGGAAAISFAKSCLELGSDLSEVQNVVDTTFKSMASEVNNFANTAMEQFGLSETVTKKYMGTLGAMSNSMGFTTAKSYEMSKAVTELAADVASFYNLSSDEAFTKLKAIWTGETESLKDIGVLLTQTNLDQYALNNGFGKTTAKMTEQEKVMLRYQYTLSALSDASGDFAKTSDSWANQTRVLSLRFESLKATLGQGFINLLTPIIKSLNELLIKLNDISIQFVNWTNVITGTNSATQSMKNISDSTGQIADNMNAVTSAVKETKRQLAGFDKITKISEESATGTISTSTGISDLTNQLSNLVNNDAYINQANQTALNIINAFKNQDYESVGTIISSKLSAGLKSIKWEEAYEAAKGFGSGLASFFNGLFTPELFSTTGSTIAKSINTAINAALTLGTEFDFSNLGNCIAGGINGFFSDFNFAEVGPTISTWLIGYMDMWTSAIKNIDWENIGDAVSDTLKGINWNGIIHSSLNLLGVAINGGLELVAELIDAAPIETAIIAGIAALKYTGLAAKVTESISPLISKALGKIKPYAITITIAAVTIKLAQDKLEPIWEENSFNDIKKASEEMFTDWLGNNPLSLCLSDTFLTISSFIVDFEGIKQALSMANEDIVNGDFKLEIGHIITLPSMNELKSAYNAWTKDFLSGNFRLSLPFGIELPSVNDVKNKISNLWKKVKSSSKNLVVSIGKFKLPSFDNIKTGFKNLGNTIKKPFNAISSWFSTKFSGAGNSIINAISTSAIGKKFNTIWSTIKSPFMKAGTWFYNIFKGCVSKITTVFSPIKGWFSTLFDGVKNVIKAPLNLVIGFINSILKGVETAINFVIKGLNKLSFKVPSWVPGIGGEKWGFNIKQLSFTEVPKLAQGGYVKANTPQLAIIGDNMHQGEIVSPENKLKEMAREAAEMSGNGNNEAIIKLLTQILAAILDIEFDITLDGESLKNKIVSRINANTRRTGVCEINI